MPSKACLRLTVPPFPSRYLNSICSSLAAEQHEVLDPLRQALERRLDVEFRMPRQRLNQLEVIRIAPIPAAHRAAGKRQMRIRDDLLGVEELLRAETIAGRASAGRAVEREQPRLELGERVAADRAGKLVGEHELRRAPAHPYRRLARLPPQPQRGLERLGETLTQARPHLEAIDDRLDRMLAPHVEFRRLVDLDHRCRRCALARSRRPAVPR